MKNTKLILLMSIVTVTVFCTVAFTACTKKVTCSSVYCRNNGVCTNGSCVCPTGFSGSFCEVGATTYISYINNTFTPITLSINGASQVIPVGQSVAISGTYGTVATGTATTSGSASSLGIDIGGGVIGLAINWAINDTFPPVATDTLKNPLGVGATYFFLRMANKSGLNIINYTVDNTLADSTAQEVTVPNTGITYNLGYYLASPSSNVLATLSNGSSVSASIPLPFTSNQAYTVTIN